MRQAMRRILVLVLGTITVLMWVFAAFAFVLTRVDLGDGPGSPDVSSLPVPDGWTVVSDQDCGGSHCSERYIELSGPGVNTSGLRQQLDQLLVGNGWTANSPAPGQFSDQSVEGDRDGIVAHYSWPDQTQTSAIHAYVGYESDAAGMVHLRDDQNRVLLVAVGVSAALTALTALVGRRLWTPAADRQATRPEAGVLPSETP